MRITLYTITETRPIFRPTPLAACTNFAPHPNFSIDYVIFSISQLFSLQHLRQNYRYNQNVQPLSAEPLVLFKSPSLYYSASRFPPTLSVHSDILTIPHRQNGTQLRSSLFSLSAHLQAPNKATAAVEPVSHPIAHCRYNLQQGYADS